MTPRGLLTTIGATALGFGLVIGGAPALPDVFAQEATPPAAEAPAQTEQGQRIDGGSAAALPGTVSARTEEARLRTTRRDELGINEDKAKK